MASLPTPKKPLCTARSAISLKQIEERELYQALSKALSAIAVRQEERKFEQMKRALHKLQTSLVAKDNPAPDHPGAE